MGQHKLHLPIVELVIRLRAQTVRNYRVITQQLFILNACKHSKQIFDAILKAYACNKKHALSQAATGILLSGSKTSCLRPHDTWLFFPTSTNVGRYFFSVYLPLRR